MRLSLIFMLAFATCYSQITWRTYTVGDGSITRTLCPVSKQLYPRNEQNMAVVRLAGTITDVANISFRVVCRSIEGKKKQIYNRVHRVRHGEFDVNIPIHAELSEYTFYYTPVKKNAVEKVIADSVLCGDVYVVAGQSNMDTWSLTSEEFSYFDRYYGPGYYSPPLTPYHKYCRGFGELLPYPDKLTWGITALGYHPYKHVGAPAQVMQYEIVRKYGIPVCVINGALGGADITNFFLPAPGKDYFNQATYTIAPKGIPENNMHAYGFFSMLNTNVYAAGFERDIKGIFWLQGDAGKFNNEIGYIEEFKKLHDLWLRYFPGMRKTYLIQVHSWIAAEQDMRTISEQQRQIPLYIPDVELLSANGIGHHVTEPQKEMHFTAKGYENLGMRMLGVLERDVYSSRGREVLPPNVTGIVRRHYEVTVYFDQELSESLSDPLDSVLSVIKFEAGYYKKSNPRIRGHRFIFDVADTAINTVSYAGFIPGAYRESPYFARPDFPCYLRNANNIAALSFDGIPFTDPENAAPLENLAPEAVSARKKVRIFPTLVTESVTIEGVGSLENITISDARGIIVFAQDKHKSNRLEVGMSTLNVGIYHIKGYDSVAGWFMAHLVKTD